MRLVSTICFIIFIVLGLIVAFNIFAYVLGFFVVQRKKKGNIIFLLIFVLSIFFLSLSGLFFTMQYKYITYILFGISIALFLIFVIIVSNNLFEKYIRNTPENTSNNQPVVKNTSKVEHHNNKNEPGFFTTVLALFGIFYIFHELIDDNDNHNHHDYDYNNYDNHDDHHDDYQDYDDSNTYDDDHYYDDDL